MIDFTMNISRSRLGHRSFSRGPLQRETCVAYVYAKNRVEAIARTREVYPRHAGWDRILIVAESERGRWT